MKILHIGREENMERYPAPDYIAEEIETVSLPMGKRPEDYLDAMEEAQVIVADAMADVPGALIRKMPHLKMIHSEGVAYNRIDMCMLAPVLAEQAGLPLTPYYSYMLAMREDVTVFTAGNDFMDASGVTHTYGENAAMDEWVHGYFALEYNNIGTHAHRNQALFTVPESE